MGPMGVGYISNMGAHQAYHQLGHQVPGGARKPAKYGLGSTTSRPGAKYCAQIYYHSLVYES